MGEGIMTDLGAKPTEGDLRFIAATLYPGHRDLERVASALREDMEVFRSALESTLCLALTPSDESDIMKVMH